jgi:hypothetical protein
MCRHVIDLKNGYNPNMENIVIEKRHGYYWAYLGLIKKRKCKPKSQYFYRVTTCFRNSIVALWII